MENGLLTIAQAAEYLQLSEKTIRRLISDEKIVAYKVGDRSWRIRMSDITGLKFCKSHLTIIIKGLKKIWLNTFFKAQKYK